MNYLLDRRTKRNKIAKISMSVVVFIVLFFFRVQIFNSLSSLGHSIFRPVLVLGNNIGEKFKNFGSYFVFKSHLYLQNENLLLSVKSNDARMANYDSILSENISLKEILGRKNEKSHIVLSAILSKSDRSAYDTLIIDVGSENQVEIGNIVFAFGSIPIGRVEIVYKNSSEVTLFSKYGERTQAIVSNEDVFLELVGRGGGNFEMILPRDFVLKKEDQVVMPGINPYVLAIVKTIISDPRDPFTKALLASPVNINELKFVEVGIEKK